MYFLKHWSALQIGLECIPLMQSSTCFWWVWFLEAKVSSSGMICLCSAWEWWICLEGAVVCQHWSRRGHHTLSARTAKPTEGQQLIRAGLRRPEKPLGSVIGRKIQFSRILIKMVIKPLAMACSASKWNCSFEPHKIRIVLLPWQAAGPKIK